MAIVKGRKEFSIDINGSIYPEQSFYAEDCGYISLRTVKDALKLVPSDCQALRVKINTPGGVVDEAFAIVNELWDFCQSRAIVLITRASGQVASAGNIVMVSGTEREQFNNSQYFVHNPNFDPWDLAFSYSGLEAKDLEDLAAYLRQEEERLLTYLSDQTGADIEQIRGFMDGKITLTSDQALELSFANENLDDVKTVTKNFLEIMVLNMAKEPHNPIKLDKMSKSKDLKTAVNKLKTTAKTKGIVLNTSTATTSDGKTLEFSSYTPTVGDTVTIDGQTAEDGTYSMEDGSEIVVKDGMVESITPASSNEGEVIPPASENVATQLKALNKKVIDMGAKIEKLEKEKEESDVIVSESIEAVNELTKRLEGTVSNFKPVARKTETNQGGKNVTKTVVADTPEARGAAAVERLKAKNEAKKQEAKK